MSGSSSSGMTQKAHVVLIIDEINVQSVRSGVSFQLLCTTSNLDILAVPTVVEEVYLLNPNDAKAQDICSRKQVGTALAKPADEAVHFQIYSNKKHKKKHTKKTMEVITSPIKEDGIK